MSKKNFPKESPKYRSKYVDHSRNFKEWVNQLGFEKTFLGRLALFLDTKFSLRRVALIFSYGLALAFLMFIGVHL